MTIDHRKLVTLTNYNSPYVEYITSKDGYQVTDTVTRYTKPVFLIDNLFGDATLDLNFASTKSIGDLVTFSRASTGTYVGSDGLIKTAVADAPRFDHDPVTGESLGLLIEEARTNKMLRSENLAKGGTWQGPDGAASSLSDITSPDGVSKMWLVNLPTQGSSSSGSRLYQGDLAFDNVVNTFSFYARSVSGTGTFPVGYYDGSNYIKSYVTLTEETQRYEISCPSGLSAGSTTNIFGFTRRGTTHDETLTQAYVWGCQVEAGSFPTSYIPTTDSVVTRAPDIASIEGTNFSSWYNQSEGTVYSDITTQWLSGRSTNGTILQIDNGTNSTGRLFHKRKGSSGQHDFKFSGTDVSIAVPTNSYKAASGYNTSSYITCVDKTLSGEGNVVTGDLNTLNRAQIGSNNGSNYLSGHISRLAYFPTRKTDQELIDLTK